LNFVVINCLDGISVVFAEREREKSIKNKETLVRYRRIYAAQLIQE
jgi:hypothetical protein